MSHDDLHAKLSQFEHGLIRRKVNQIIKHPGFSHQDIEDLTQELGLRVLQALPAFDPTQSHRNAFATTVVERYAANILRNRQAGKRSHHGITSLNVTIHVEGEGPTELAQTISQRELDARRGVAPRSDEELVQLASDMAEVIATFPNRLQELARRRQTQSLPEIAREMGIPRTTLNEWQRKIRQRFEKAGLKHYL